MGYNQIRHAGHNLGRGNLAACGGIPDADCSRKWTAFGARRNDGAMPVVQPGIASGRNCLDSFSPCDW